MTKPHHNKGRSPANKGKSKYGVPSQIDGKYNPEYHRIRSRMHPRPKGPNPRRIEVEYRAIIISFLLDRDGRNCGICGGLLDADLHIDHIVPVFEGGSHHHGNVRLTHRFCNLRRSRRG